MPADPHPSFASAFPSASPPHRTHQPPEPSRPHRPMPTRTLHLGAAIDCGGPYAVESYLPLARLAESGALDFVTLGGGGPPAGGPGATVATAAGARSGAGAGAGAGAGGDTGAGADSGAGPPDAVGVLARIASGADRIGLLAAAPAARGPGTAAEVAALDRASRGRAGWVVTSAAEVGAFAGVAGLAGGTGTLSGAGRKSGAALGAARRAAAAGAFEAAEAATAAVRTWQGMRASGTCPPDCRPVVALDATEPAAREVAARVADIALVRADRPESAGLVRAELRALAEQAGRDPDRLLVLADLAVDLGGGELGAEPGAEPVPAGGAGGPLFRGGPVDLADLVARWQRAGAVDGFHVRPVEPARDLERFVNGTVALLQHRGLFRTFHPGATLREHLGLHRPARAAAAGPPAPPDTLPDAYGRLG